MIVCDVSAIDRLIDMYGETLSVFYKGDKYELYDLRETFIDVNFECSVDNFTASSLGISDKDNNIIVGINPQQEYIKDDLNKI